MNFCPIPQHSIHGKGGRPALPPALPDVQLHPSKIEASLHYAGLGWAIFPVHYMTDENICSCGGKAVNPKCKPGKHPFGALVPKGLNNASANLDTVRRWFDSTSYNIGIATGNASGFWVLDIDGAEGAAALVELEKKNGPLPETLRVATGGGGTHYYFQMPSGTDIRNSEKKIGAGIDVRGTGGYVVAPPSNHESGNTYQWDGCALPAVDMIVNAPQWLMSLVAFAGIPGKPLVAVAKTTLAQLQPRQFEWPDKIGDGEGREAFILKAAGHLRGKGLDQPAIERFLLDYNRAHIVPPLEDEAVLDRTRRYETQDRVDVSNDTDWPEPEEIKASLPPVPPFDDRLLPPVFRAWVTDIAERMQCPPDFLAVGAMVAAGAVVGNRVGVQPKQRDTSWIEVPNLWGAVVGRPGVMKTPALAQVLLPLRRLESQALTAFTATRAQYELDKMHYEGNRRHIEKQIKKGATILPGQLPVPPEEPQPPRYLLNDATYQKLGAVLSGNPHGLMVFQDELSGLLQRLDSDGQEAARAFYLEAWTGQQPYTFDRIGRGTVRIPRLCFSLLGCLQPSKLREYLRSAVYGGKGDDGFAQRLQMLVFPDIDPTWTQVDRLPDLAAATAAEDIFNVLATLDPCAGGAREPYPGCVPVFGFDEPAQDLFNLWRAVLENGLRSGDEHPALESHISKYRTLVPALALLDHLILNKTGDIGTGSLKRAIHWQQFLLEHAKRAYAAVTLATMDSAKALSGRVLRGALKDGFTVREVYRHSWSMLSTTKEAAEAVAVLVDLGWLRPVQDRHVNATDGRATVRYYINPRLQVAA